jgi:multiple sugar transport system permease protein
MTRQGFAEQLKGYAFIAPWLVGFAAFVLLPTLLSLYYAFHDYRLTDTILFVGWDNFRDLYHDELFWRTLGNTLKYAAMALPAGLAVSLGLALLLNVQIPGQPLFRTIIFLPSLVPAVAGAMVWLWLLNGRQGLVNLLLSYVGITGPSYLADPRWVLPTFAVMSVWGVGNTVVIYLAGLQDVPRELYEAAEIDGASAAQRLWHVTLPLLSPVIFFNLIMAIIGSLQTFAQPFLMTGGGPDNASRFYAMYVYDNAFTYLKMGYASAMAWIQLLIILALTVLAFWTSKHWVHYQSK